jgi:hypothetical protein
VPNKKTGDGNSGDRERKSVCSKGRFGVGVPYKTPVIAIILAQLKNYVGVSAVNKIGTKMSVGFRIRKPSVPRASIIWLAYGVKVVRLNFPRLHLDRVRYAIDGT